MWIRHPQTHHLVLVLDETHITRLLAEGGVEESAPLPSVSVPTSEPVVTAPQKEKVTTGSPRPKKGR